jgi:hypothetical protein
MKATFARAVLFTGALLASKAHAGLYADDLSRCLVEKTTSEDRHALVKWIFAAAAAHPMVASVVKVSSEQMDASNKVVGALFMRLLTDSCVEQAKKAVQYEGPAVMQLSFQVLGQVASSELFSSPEVMTVIAGLQKYVDAEKLQSTLGLPAAPTKP